MEQKVDINCMTVVAGSFRSQKEQVEKCREILDEITGNLALSIMRNTSVINLLKGVQSNIGQDVATLMKMEQGLLQGAQYYQSCEQRIVAGYKSRDGNFLSSEKGNMKVDKVNHQKGEYINTAYEVFTNGAEKGVELGAGIYNATVVIKGPEGPNSFIMMDPKYADETLKWSKISSIIDSKACKIGIPIIGGIIDFIIMLLNGEGIGDAGFKSVAHIGIGGVCEAAGKKIGGMIGTAIGSAFPGVGNIIGGVIGSVIGSIIGLVIGKILSDVFDRVYDNPEGVSDYIGSIWDGTKKWVGDIGNCIGDAFVSNWNFIGSVFG